jgi:hypothetical protein
VRLPVGADGRDPAQPLGGEVVEFVPVNTLMPG